MSDTIPPTVLERLRFTDRCASEADAQGEDLGLLHLLAQSEQQQIAQFFSERTCFPGELIVQEDRAGDTMYLIRTGRVAVIKGNVQDPVILGFRGEGSMVGEMALLENRPRSASVVALDTVSLYGLSREKFHQVLREMPEVSQRMMSTLSARLRVADQARSEAGQEEIQELREQAMRDQLTGLFNRRYLEETLAREIARARREGSTVGVIMLDVDFFKQVNDTYGHLGGDRMLQALGKLLEGCIRSEDVACRYGGEEFVVIMPGARTDVVVGRAESVRVEFGALRIPFEGREMQATLSLGVAMVPEDGCNGEVVLDCADRALYQAKQAGRNRVAVWGE